MAERAVEPAPSGQISTIVENLGRVVHAPDETLRLIVLGLVAEGHAIPVARVQAMHEGKRRARARRG
jgi:hypothetical protein